MHRTCLIVLAMSLSACGAEVASTAATAASLQATQARQASDQQRLIEASLGAALKAGEARASAATP